jgi:PPOX class probable F420-dependent enzyme
MKKIPREDPRSKHMSTNTEVDRAGLIEFVTGKNRWVLSTTRSDGRPQMSLVTGTITPEGELLVSTYPQRVKTRNAKRNPQVSVAVMGDEFNAAWVQIDGDAEVLDMPEAADGLVEYFRCIKGDHPDWDEYRQAMADQGKSVIRIRPTRWGPISTGGFPPELFEDEA